MKLALALALVIWPCVMRADSSSRRSVEWRDLAGRVYTSADLARHKATVFIFSSTQCPISNLYTQRMIDLAKTFSSKGVQFFLVDSNREDSSAAIAAYAKERKFPFPAIKDNGTALADRLDAHITPEAVILDSTATVRYRGRIDDNKEREKVARQDVKEALEALVAGKPVPHSRTLPFGCAIFRDTPTALRGRPSAVNVTYNRDVAPILNQNCVVCHRTGEVAPFSLETYQQARTWAKPIKDYTSRRIMPPWKPVAGYGEFHDSRNLTDAQIATLAKWAESGAPAGDPKVAPTAPRFPSAAAWTLGQPDQVIQPVRDYHLEAEGKDVYRNFVLPVDFKEDRYLSAMEFKPGNRAAVHHIVAYLDLTGESTKLEGKETEPGYTVPGIGIGVLNAQWGDVWVPGSAPRFLPSGIAIKIPAGSKLVMQVHYHKSGKPEVDRSQCAFYFAKGKVEKQILTWFAGDPFFQLKPGEPRQEVKTTLPLSQDVRLWSIFPHMHMLGKEMKVIAALPDGTEKKLIFIDDWDFNWQATYHYKQPISLPKGTVLRVEAIYDNSESNPRQTSHPPKLVRFGEQTTDEMCFCFFGLTVERKEIASGK